MERVQKGWAVMRRVSGTKRGRLYVGWDITRRGAIEGHSLLTGDRWATCRKSGARLVKIEIHYDDEKAT